MTTISEPLFASAALVALTTAVLLFLTWRRRPRPVAQQQPVLTYLDCKGSGEAIRLALSLGNVAFVDERLTYDELRRRRSEFPFGQLPTLRLEPETYAQSDAILRWAGDAAGLYPRQAQAWLLCDMVLEAVAEIRSHLLPLWYGSALRRHPTTGKPMCPLSPDQIAEARTCVEEAYLPARFAQLARLLGENKFFGGRNPTIADIAFYVESSQILDGTYRVVPGIDPAVLQSFPTLVALTRRIAALPPIRAWNDNHNY
jgi:glutathione S-transferase